MVVLACDINVTKRQKSPYRTDVNDEWSLNDYHAVAKRCICRFAGGSIASKMLRCEEAIGHVAFWLMQATYNYDETRGCTLYSWRNYNAKQAIIRWIEKMRCDPQPQSLHMIISSGEHTPCELHQSIADNKAEQPSHCVEHCELFDGLEHRFGLTDKQAHYCREHFINKQSCAQIARLHNISRQAVHDSILTAVKQIRELHAQGVSV